MKEYLFIDGSYYIFYRYFALCQWWKNSHPDEPLELPSKNDEFVLKFKNMFNKKLDELIKKLKLKPCVVYVGKDCTRGEIWRVKHYGEYKKNRVNNTDIGYFFEMVYKEKMFEKWNSATVLSYNNLEADDCIALSVKHINSLSDGTVSNMTIITSDHDYLQLLNDNVTIYDLKYKNILECKNVFDDPKKNLEIKIIMGDKSDNISSTFTKCGIKSAIKCIENPEYFKKKVDRDIYNLNKLLIDFNSIPKELKDGFYKMFVDIKYLHSQID